MCNNDECVIVSACNNDSSTYLFITMHNVSLFNENHYVNENHYAFIITTHSLCNDFQCLMKIIMLMKINVY